MEPNPGFGRTMSISTAPPRQPIIRAGLVRPRHRGRRILAWSVGTLLVVVSVGWFGLQPQPEPFPAVALPAGPVETVPLPEGLPAPVERFYAALYGEQVPVIDSAVITGSGTMRVAGITFPARFRFSHVSGVDYRHYIEATVFGRAVMRVDEHFLDGRATLELPFGVSSGPNIDHGANLALWAEAVMMPSVWVTDARVRWDPVDDVTATLSVPFGATTETFTVTFDPATGLLVRMESMRFKGETDTAKTRWINEVVEWGEVGGHPVPVRATVAWADEGSPWANLTTDDVVYNADLTDYVRQNGP